MCQLRLIKRSNHVNNNLFLTGQPCFYCVSLIMPSRYLNITAAGLTIKYQADKTGSRTISRQNNHSFNNDSWTDKFINIIVIIWFWFCHHQVQNILIFRLGKGGGIVQSLPFLWPSRGAVYLSVAEGRGQLQTWQNGSLNESHLKESLVMETVVQNTRQHRGAERYDVLQDRGQSLYNANTLKNLKWVLYFILVVFLQ